MKDEIRFTRFTKNSTGYIDKKTTLTIATEETMKTTVSIHTVDIVSGKTIDRAGRIYLDPVKQHFEMVEYLTELAETFEYLVPIVKDWIRIVKSTLPYLCI